MKRILLPLLLLLAASAPAAAQITPETLISLRRVGAPTVSPDGATILHTLTEVSLEANRGTTQIWAVPTAGGEPRRLTEAATSSSSPQWRPDGRKIGFMRGGQFWEMNPDGSDPVQLTSIDGGVGNVLWSPTGTHIAYTRDVQITPTPLQRYPDLPNANVRLYDGLMYRHWDTWEDGAYSHVFIAPYRTGSVGEGTDLMPGEPYDAPLKPFGGAEQLAWHPDGNRFIYTAKKLSGAEAAVSTNSDLYLYDRSTGTTRNLTADNAGYDTNPVFSPDGRMLVWSRMTTPMYEADRHRLMAMDLASGSMRELSFGLDQNVDSPVFAKNGSHIYFLSGVEATVQVFSMDLRARSTNPPVKQLTYGVHDFTSLSVGRLRNTEVLVGGVQSMSAPTDLWRVDAATGELSRLTDANADRLNGIALGKVESRWVPTTDGKQMKVWVIFPPNFDPTKKYPTLLYCQGGPQGTVSQFFSYRWNFQTLASAGYVIVAPNRRGLPSFGQEWNRQISGDWGGQAMKDLLSAIDNVAAEPWADESRLGAVGASFGGYSVFWLAGNHQNRFKSFIAHAGVFNLESMYGHTEELFFAEFDMGGSYWQQPQPESYRTDSPHLYVDRWTTPMLIIHGERDYRVPVSEGMQAFTALQRQGIRSRLVLFPEENHWILSPQNSVLWHREFFGWLKETL